MLTTAATTLSPPLNPAAVPSSRLSATLAQLRAASSTPLRNLGCAVIVRGDIAYVPLELARLFAADADAAAAMAARRADAALKAAMESFAATEASMRDRCAAAVRAARREAAGAANARATIAEAAAAAAEHELATTKELAALGEAALATAKAGLAEARARMIDGDVETASLREALAAKEAELAAAVAECARLVDAVHEQQHEHTRHFQHAASAHASCTSEVIAPPEDHPPDLPSFPRALLQATAAASLEPNSAQSAPSQQGQDMDYENRVEGHGSKLTRAGKGDGSRYSSSHGVSDGEENDEVLHAEVDTVRPQAESSTQAALLSTPIVPDLEESEDERIVIVAPEQRPAMKFAAPDSHAVAARSAPTSVAAARQPPTRLSVTAARARAPGVAVSVSPAEVTALASSAIASEESVAKRVAVLEKRWRKEREAVEAAAAIAAAAAARRAAKAAAEAAETSAALAASQAETASLRTRVARVAELEREAEALAGARAEVAAANAATAAANARAAELDKLYRSEALLRKQYFNVIEDMKGKVRVFARCRPVSASERERSSTVVVSLPDDVTVDLATAKGARQFVFDRAFGPASSQADIFADTESLVRSALDGYNVAVFAYGQTGSGKTHTMVGSRDAPGLTPRAVDRLFALREEARGVAEVSVQAYMVELYLDGLEDLFYKLGSSSGCSPPPPPPPKLEIKKDDDGLVVVKGVTLRACESAAATLALFEAGAAARHTSATSMNATSSRSHLIFALVVRTRNLQTRKVAAGKLSLIDLAGSERVAKTGATAERLREATAINVSLSALGNVISALSSGAAFVPYRDNKLTQLMADSLGGNAKTLMFVNISPVEYNADETHAALVYAARVKLITNSAEKSIETDAIRRLKAVIAKLRGERVDASASDSAWKEGRDAAMEEGAEEPPAATAGDDMVTALAAEEAAVAI